MPDLQFQIDGVEAPAFAAAPLLAFKLRVTNALSDEPIHTVVLRCQVQISATRRRYSPTDQERLLDLFGEPERWSQTLRTLLWTHASVVVPSFTGSTVVDLPVPCTYDFNVAATKYFYALEEGEIPLLFLFSGTVFYAAGHAPLQIAQISWDREAAFRLPVKVWQEMMNLYYPQSAWLRVRQDVFDQLYRYKLQHGLPTWEQALESLLAGKSEISA
ncbi:MAG: hypothetical protein H0X37_22375 [Herpetosiphonaceae bacterium]|nr:hypothetical protein [Herpetosiphonaceae bacterium]